MLNAKGLARTGDLVDICIEQEPLNKGHIGTCHFVHYREVVLFLSTVDPLNKGHAILSTIERLSSSLVQWNL